MQYMRKKITYNVLYAGLIMISFLFTSPYFARAQEVVSEKQTIMKAEVLEVMEQERREIPGLDTTTDFQKLRVRILEGEERGKEVVVENDYLNLRAEDIFYLMHTTNSVDGTDQYSVSDPYRLPVIYFFLALFVAVVFMFGGMPGVRGLLSLIFSLLVITYVLLPGILYGYSPVVLSTVISAVIIIAGSYMTHGFNKTTTAAVVGMLVTIVVTGALAYCAVTYGRLSGFETEESVYLNFNTGGAINFSGLLLGGIMIGVLGILYDAAIGQAVAVEELQKAGPHLDRPAIYQRALRIGREHIGALVDTLAIAYVGVSLPLLLLFYMSGSDFMLTINREIFATEILRAMVGGIGLILSIPISTFFSTRLLVPNKANNVSR